MFKLLLFMFIKKQYNFVNENNTFFREMRPVFYSSFPPLDSTSAKVIEILS